MTYRAARRGRRRRGGPRPDRTLPPARGRGLAARARRTSTRPTARSPARSSAASRRQGGADADRGRSPDRRLFPLLREDRQPCRRRAIARRSTRRSARRWSATAASSSWARTSPAAPARNGDQDAWGGPLGVTKGLRPQFGPDRVLDTHLAEISFVGAAAGAAATGLRPVVELMFVDFMGVCFDQIFNQAAKFRYMFGGKAVTPLVVRTMYGAGFRAASQHSQCLYPDLHPHPRPEGGAAVEPLRGQGPADPGDPRRRPGHLLRAQGHVRHGGRGAGRALRHPLRRGQCRRARAMT